MRRLPVVAAAVLMCLALSATAALAQEAVAVAVGGQSPCRGAIAVLRALLADPVYAPLIASSEARRLRLVKPADDEDEQVGLAPPDGRGALTAKPEEKLAAYL